MGSLAMRCESAFLRPTAEGLDCGRRRRARAACSSLGTIRPNKPRKQTTLRAALIAEPKANARRTAPLVFGSGKQEAFKTQEPGQKRRDPISNPERLDEWVAESITEIVKNIGKAPFLVHVYSDMGKASPLRLQREKAMEGNWPRIASRWEENGNQTPDGVILVKQLNSSNCHCIDNEDEKQSAMEKKGNSDANSRSSSSSLCSLWGIIIQGRGLNRSACYILETTRVCSSMGFSTHFCLVRAKCFDGKSPELQLRDSWLLTR